LRTPKLCNWSGSPRCLKTAVSGGRCEEHKRVPFDGAKQRWNSNRPAGYETVRRKTIRRAKGRCEECGAPGAQVDKIIPQAEGGTWTLDNTQYLCKPCHDLKTQRDAQRGRQRRS
jgi:5-methylcytosine-specific restriction protein A